MPQFAVFRNPGRDTATPFLLQIQSNRLEGTRGRVLIALHRRSAGGPPDRSLSPHFVIQGVVVWANSLNLVTMPADRLRDVLEILPEADQDRIIRAIDEMISRA